MIMIGASIHANSLKFFISFFLFVTLIFQSQAIAESKTKKCKAVDVLAEVYYYTEDHLSIGVYGDDEDKHCQFSINGATKTENEQNLQIIRDVISNIRNLRLASERKNTQVVYDLRRIEPNWIYLIAAPNLKDGIPEDLSKVFEKFHNENSNCIYDFYAHKSPNIDKEIFSCSVIDDQKKILSIKLMIGSYYELLLFR